MMKVMDRYVLSDFVLLLHVHPVRYFDSSLFVLMLFEAAHPKYLVSLCTSSRL